MHRSHKAGLPSPALITARPAKKDMHANDAPARMSHDIVDDSSHCSRRCVSDSDSLKSHSSRFLTAARSALVLTIADPSHIWPQEPPTPDFFTLRHLSRIHCKLCDAPKQRNNVHEREGHLLRTKEKDRPELIEEELGVVEFESRVGFGAVRETEAMAMGRRKEDRERANATKESAYVSTAVVDVSMIESQRTLDPEYFKGQTCRSSP